MIMLQCKCMTFIFYLTISFTMYIHLQSNKLRRFLKVSLAFKEKRFFTSDLILFSKFYTKKI